jgi:hypothetical protein
MPIDFRYYISSLAAIFLALGIGIVIGGALMGNDEIVKSQEMLILSLEQEFQQLRSEKKYLQDGLKARDLEIEVLRQFNREILPLLVKDLLTDRKIAVIKTNPTIDSGLTAEMIKILHQAGAEVQRIINFTEWPDLTLESKTVAARLGFKADELWLEHLFSRFMEEVASGERDEILSSLQANNLIQVNGNIKEPIDTLILFGGSHDEKMIRVDEFDLTLVKTAQNIGLTVVGVEPLSASFSYIRKYKNTGLITIDNVDTLPGQVALVFALVSGKKGEFGVKETAQALLPKLPPKLPTRTR